MCRYRLTALNVSRSFANAQVHPQRNAGFAVMLAGSEPIALANEWTMVGPYRVMWGGRPNMVDAQETGIQFLRQLATAWACDGVASLQRIRGAWALLIDDPQRQRLCAASDRFGSVPLYYQHSAAKLSIATSPSVFKDGCAGQIDRGALVQYLTFAMSQMITICNAAFAGCFLAKVFKSNMENLKFTLRQSDSISQRFDRSRKLTCQKSQRCI